ncbi:hypothetical protein Anas_10675 [Armadillidium nasatum]|uniref:Uncharacterized protein n=1 Tax=Armadillidium nasatum TaxID=96803 RepID=A0A5N5SRJ0_9CRUS|nr:hypothetical protein Anas_10675 [Armadillidium nasatum]
MRPWTFLAFLVVILALAFTSPVPDWSDELFLLWRPQCRKQIGEKSQYSRDRHWISLPRTLLRFFFSFS